MEMVAVKDQVWALDDGTSRLSGNDFIARMVRIGRFRSEEDGHTILALSKKGDDVVTGVYSYWTRIH